MEKHAQNENKHQEFQIFCSELTHRDQLVEFLLMKQHTQHKTRLLCRKCIQGPYSCYQNEVCLLSDLFKDQYTNLQFTSYQQNPNQQFVEFLKNINYKINFDQLKHKISEMRNTITYEIDLLEQNLYEACTKYQDQLNNINGLINNFEQNFNSDEIIELLKSYSGQKLTPKMNKELKDTLGKYVEKFHSTPKNEYDFKQKFQKLEEEKKRFYTSYNNMRVFREKLDEGESIIINQIRQMNGLFSPLKLNTTQLGNFYTDQILEQIDPCFKESKNVFDKIKRIYSNNYDGLEYQKIYETLSSNQNKPMIIILKTQSEQVIGAYINKGKSFLYSQNKRQVFLLKQNQQPLILNNKVDRTNSLFSFGTKDLIVNSHFDNCTSVLGTSYQLEAQYDIGDVTMHLANQHSFSIIAIEIFSIDL